MREPRKSTGDGQVGSVHRVAVEDVLRRPVDRRTVLRLAGRSAAGLWLVGGMGGLAAACGDDGGGGSTTTVEPGGELWGLSLEEVAGLVADKQVSPVELTRQQLDRIDRLNPQLNAFITVTPDLALAQARSAEEDIAADRYRSPLQGIPVAHKDVFDTSGVLTTAGSRVFADRVPDADAAVVALLTEAGAVTVGKLNLLEFASGLAGVNPHFGPTHNPWNLDMFSGGSSSGSGAATSAGLVYAATGTDTGGSIRLPAAFCGVVGLMPTFGRVSMRGAFSGTRTFDHAGPLARTVRDTAIVLQVIAGPDPRDPNTSDVPVPDYLDGIEEGPGGLRIGVPRGGFWEDLDPEIESSVQEALDAMARAGAIVRDVAFPNVPRYLSAATDVSLIETMEAHAETYPSRSDDYGTDVAALLELYRGIPVSTLEQMRQEGLAVIATARNGEADEVLAAVDVLAVPTSKRPVFSIAEAQEKYDRGDYAVTVSEARFENTIVFDATGQPAISVPCGFTSNDMPIGLMLVARRWDEPTLLRAARAYEQVRGPFPMPPI